MRKVRIGVIGCGNMGSNHVKSIMGGKVPAAELCAICDVSEARRETLKKMFPDVPIFSSAEELMDSGLCEAVLIATPHYDHPRLVIEALEKGLHVLSEKPAGVYTKQVREMNEAAAKTDRVFAIMYNQRTNPAYQKLRTMIQEGQLGHIKRVTWIVTHWYRPQAYHDSNVWRSTWKDEGGGALINQNPHQLDLWQWMFGMPDKVFARVCFGKYHNIEVEDDLVALFEYENGTMGEYITSTGEAPGTNRLEVACDMGKIVIENNQMLFERNVISEREFEKNNTLPFGKPECWKCLLPVDVSGGEQHQGIIQNFAEAILNGTALLSPGEEGIRGLTISNAIHLSGWTGETVDVKNFPHDRFYALLQEKIRNSNIEKHVKEQTVDTAGTY
ncbi:MAG: Gfo/Idh/MocA family oxidoreductase [Ruminococcaceae bacterium]|nr:Gfo/Idh/MocA family oxidoreductase [Oscillospiraceae bacterium]